VCIPPHLDLVMPDVVAACSLVIEGPLLFPNFLPLSRAPPFPREIYGAGLPFALLFFFVPCPLSPLILFVVLSPPRSLCQPVPFAASRLCIVVRSRPYSHGVSRVAPFVFSPPRHCSSCWRCRPPFFVFILLLRCLAHRYPAFVRLDQALFVAPSRFSRLAA